MLLVKPGVFKSLFFMIANRFLGPPSITNINQFILSNIYKTRQTIHPHELHQTIY